jgi:hypothetical protein
MNATKRDGSLSWNGFLLPTYHVLRFVSEGLTVFAEVFPETEALISVEEKTDHRQLSKYFFAEKLSAPLLGVLSVPAAKRRKEPTGSKDKRLLVSLAPVYEACTMTRHSQLERFLLPSPSFSASESLCRLRRAEIPA